jgi:hypothetical protein
MRWPSGRTNQDAYFARVGQWHTWYAWHPVLIDGRWVWLEHVERRGGRLEHVERRGGRLYISGWGTQWEHRCLKSEGA